MQHYFRVIKCLILAGFLLCIVSVLQAAPWAVVADRRMAMISMLDFGTTPPTVYGPFLQGQLGTTNSAALLDAAITLDGQQVLLSHFTDQAIYRVDISNPTNPVVTGCVSNGFTPEDVAIAPNGRFALVTDGYNAAYWTNMAIIDLSSFSTSITYSITSGAAHAVTVAPDNQTVILCDYASDRIIYGIMGSNGLVSESVLTNGVNMPVNVAVAPDGKTVLVANRNTNEVNVFQIVSPGNVVTGETPSVVGFTSSCDASQSIAFSPAGDRAYVLQKGNATNMLSWLKINSPGNVTLGGADAARLLSKAYEGSFIGVDTLAVSPDGAWALAGNPTGGNTTNVLSLVNLSTFAVSPLDVYLEEPVGVAFVLTPGFSTQVASDADPANRIPMASEAVTFQITVTNTGYQILNPVQLDFGFDTNHLVYAGGAPAADIVSGGVATWTNIGPISLTGGVVMTAQFITLMRGTTTNIILTTASTLGGYQLPPRTNIAAVTIFPGKADPAMVVNGNWYLWLASMGYQISGPFNFGVSAIPLAADFDGDGKADPTMVDGDLWYVWFTGAGYQLSGGPWNFGVSGDPVAADFDGDGKADPAMVIGPLWYIWFSGANYQLSGGPWNFGVAGIPVADDFDGDGKGDPGIVVDNLWYIWFSGADYQLCGGPWDFGVAGIPVAADFDADGKADPAMVIANLWYIWFSSTGYQLSGGPWNFGVIGDPVAADFDGR